MSVDATTLGLAVVILVQTAGVAFFLGSLSNRVTANEKRIKDLETGEDAEGNRRSDVIERLVKVETRVELQTSQMEALTREVRGLSRQVASLVTHGRPGVANFMDAQGE